MMPHESHVTSVSLFSCGSGLDLEMLSIKRLLPILVAVLCVHAACQVKPAGGPPVPRDMTVDGDPFQTPTGIYFRSYTDFEIADDIPIAFIRTQRNRDPESRAFGRG